MSFFGKTVATLALLSLTACGGGGGGSSSGTVGGGGGGLTHADLAEEFVDRLWTDVGIDAELVKTYTLQTDYIVVYDHDLDVYDAYYIGDYIVGEDMFNYLDIYDADFYYDLDYIGNNEYEDFWTGIVFEKTNATSKDLLKVTALKETIMIKKNADAIAAEYGLSAERAIDIAKLTLQWKNTPKGRMTDADHDAFAKEVLGYSISEYKDAAKAKAEGNGAALADLVKGTAAHNGVTPEDVDDIIKDVFAVSALK